MMKDKSIVVNTNRSWGDAAVDGLWPGLVGGLLMLAYLLIYELINGREPAEIFAYFLIDENMPALAGLGLHLATSAVYGAILGLFTGLFGRFRPNWLPFWLVGMLFGFVLWLGAVLVVIPSGMSGLGAVSAVHLLIAHLLYGLAAGRVLAKSRP